MSTSNAYGDEVRALRIADELAALAADKRVDPAIRLAAERAEREITSALDDLARTAESEAA